MPTKKRNPLLTTSGTRYTYAGWVRAYNAALKSGVPNLAYRLADSYPDHYNKHMTQLRAKDLGSRQHAPSPGVPQSATKPKPKTKPAETHRRNRGNTNKTGDGRTMQKQPFSAAYPHLEGAHVEITYGEYTGRSGIVKSTIPMVYKPTKDNPWKLRIELDGKFQSHGAALVTVPQTYLKRSAQQLKRDERNRKAVAAFNARPKRPVKPFSEYVAEERAKLHKR